MEEGDLKAALQSGNVAAINQALTEGDLLPAQRIGRDGFTLLHWASYYGQKEVSGGWRVVTISTPFYEQVLQKLLQLGADVLAVENHNWTPAHVSSIRGQAAAVQVIVAVKTILTYPSSTTLLHPPPPSSTLCHLPAPSCTLLLHPPSCTLLLHPPPPSCTLLHPPPAGAH